MSKYVYQTMEIPSQDEIDQLMEQAQQMRAEHIRMTFVAIPRWIAGLVRPRSHAKPKAA